MMHLEVQHSVGEPVDMLIFEQKGGRYIGFFKVVVEPPKTAVIYYMYVLKSHRRKGYSTCVLDKLKDEFDEIRTEAMASTDASVALFKKNGFEEKDNQLVWKTTNSSTLIKP